jgi:predicted aminopeptidase
MIILFIAGVVMAGYGTAYVASHEVRYLSRAGLETIRILERRRPITDLIRDPATGAETRSLLRLVLDARDFASTLGYDARDTYTTYVDVGRDTLLLVLSAAPRNCLCPYTWHYPIVGRVPYKGYFDAASAEREASAFDRRGYDTYLRPAGAFASLGWWSDPLFSTAMSHDSVELVATVLHEIAHNTLYVKSATPFNESFAQLAGYRGAEAFFRRRGSEEAARRAADRWSDEVVLSGYFGDLADRLDSLYRSAPDSQAVTAGREELGRWAREQLEGPVGGRLTTYTIGRLADRPINNARLIAAQIYRTRLALFEAWYQRHGGDIAVAVQELASLEKGATGDEAFQRLEEAVNSEQSTVNSEQ